MSDDWVNLATVNQGFLWQTPFGYVRPLYLASYWLELRTWGLSPTGFHITNILLIAATAALVGGTVLRIAGDARWAAGAGVLFALHPWHVENAAWIAARSDTSAALLAFVSLAAYETWRVRGQIGLVIASFAAFEAALLCKESVALFPVMVGCLQVARSGMVSRRECVRGLLPLAGIAAAHFLLLPKVLGQSNRVGTLAAVGMPWLKRFMDFVTAAILPLHAEQVESHAKLLAVVACSILVALLLANRSHLLSRARSTVALGVLFVCGVAPSLLSFQERYFFLPSAIAAVILAYLFLGLPKYTAFVVWSVTLVVWMCSLGWHWACWLDAGSASDHLVADLVQASRRPNAQEVVIANLPYRVAGAPLAADLSAAVRLSGGAPVTVVGATSLNLPTAAASGLDGEPASAVRIGSDNAKIRLHMPSGRFSGLFLPLSRPPNTKVQFPYASLEFDNNGGVDVTIPRTGDSERTAYVWYESGLHRLF